MTLSCRKKPVYIIKKKNINTSWGFLLLELYSFFRTENKLKCHGKICKNKDYCVVPMPTEKEIY